MNGLWVGETMKEVKFTFKLFGATTLGAANGNALTPKTSVHRSEVWRQDSHSQSQRWAAQVVCHSSLDPCWRAPLYIHGPEDRSGEGPPCDVIGWITNQRTRPVIPRRRRTQFSSLHTTTSFICPNNSQLPPFLRLPSSPYPSNVNGSSLRPGQ